MKRLESPRIVKAWFTLTTSRERTIVLAVLSAFFIGLVARYAHLQKEHADYKSASVTEIEKAD